MHAIARCMIRKIQLDGDLVVEEMGRWGMFEICGSDIIGFSVALYNICTKGNKSAAPVLQV